MTPLLSVWLDLARLAAALVVVLHHVWPVLVPHHRLPWPGHHAVVVFFVLSGFVIAFVTDRRETTLRIYAQRRAARIWSVAIPALMLGLIATPLAGPVAISDAAVPALSAWDLWRDTGLSLVFLGQLWTLDIVPPLNGPFWSLNYEVWYYALFGAWRYLAGPARVAAVLVLGLICGPKILLLMPCWLAGVWLYWHRPVLSPPVAAAVFVASLALYLLLFQFDLPILIRHRMASLWPEWTGGLKGSNTFPGDYLIAALLTANFAAVGSLERFGARLIAWRGPASTAASFTFSLYLYHMPLLALTVAGLGLRGWPAIVCLAAGIIVLGHATERNLPRMRRVLEGGWRPARLATSTPRPSGPRPPPVSGD